MSATIELITYADAIDHLIDFQRANPSAQHNRQAKRAICLAYQNFRNDHQWPYYYARGRVCTDAPYSEGGVVYDVTGGSVERQLSLFGGVGTWPDWAAFGVVIIGGVMYEVAERVSDTVLQLDIDMSPKSDINSTGNNPPVGSDYILMRHTYPLPSDFVNIDQLFTPESWHTIEYVHPRDWLVAHRYNVTSSNTPQWFTILGSADYMGAMAIGFYPFPDGEVSIDFIYQRSARPLRVDRVQGVLSSDSGDVVANFVSGTEFNDDHVGSTIRVSESNATEFPTGREGESPYSEERTIMDVNAAGDQITVDQQFLRTHSNSKYTISDPLDIEPNIMRGIFYARSEMELAKLTRMEDKQELMQTYFALLEQHRGQASRNRGPRSVYTEKQWNRRLAYMPSGQDVD